MQYSQLGKSNLNVSKICLGTMTYGEQNTQAEAFQQLDMCLDLGVNFIDCAEMYPVPGKEATQGKTEEYIGNWLQKSGARDQVILATKVTGRSQSMTWIRGENNCLNADNIKLAVEGSLKRLKTDCIDLYQLHWPDRSSNMFGMTSYPYTDDLNYAADLEESLETLATLIQAGKIKHIGLSNETPWGTLKCIHLAESKGLPLIQSVQNPYSLLNRSYEWGMSEIAHRENIGLLAYSPLAFGVLSGKYLNGARPKGTRLELFGNHFKRYLNGNAGMATESYMKIARKFGLDPVKMSLSFVNTRPFVSSNIIGATNLEQLRQNIESIDYEIPPEALAAIEKVQERFPNPAL